MILDTNIVIYSIKPKFDSLRAYLVANQEDLRVSLMTKIEALGYYKLAPPDQKKFERFFQLVPAFSLHDNVIVEAIRVRQQRKRSVRDCIIGQRLCATSYPY